MDLLTKDIDKIFKLAECFAFLAGIFGNFFDFFKKILSRERQRELNSTLGGL